MDAALVSLRNRIASNRAISIESVRTPAAILLIGLLVLASALLLLRRAAGALSEPLPTASLLAVGLAAASRCSCSDRDARDTIRQMVREFEFASSRIFSIAARQLANRTDGVVARHRHSPKLQFGNSINSYPAASANESSNRRLRTIESTTTQIEEVDHTTQKLTYLRTDDATRVEGWLRVPIEPGQRTLIAHVAFCPAFTRAPQVEAEPVDGPDCSIRATTILPWGVRFEIKLDEPAEVASDATMEFVAFEN